MNISFGFGDDLRPSGTLPPHILKYDLDIVVLQYRSFFNIERTHFDIEANKKASISKFLRYQHQHHASHVMTCNACNVV
jgi:hypothetical protein